MYYIISIISIILLIIIFKLYYRENFDNNIDESNIQLCRPNIIVDNIQKCQSSPIKPANYYYSNDNTPNFLSNILNLNKFYEIKYSNDVIDIQPNIKDISLEKIKNQKCFPSRKDAFKSEPDDWQYVNDFVMNGAKLFDNVVGFDKLNIPYDKYFDNDDNQDYYYKSCSNQISCNIQPDDIREGLGYPGQDYREYN